MGVGKKLQDKARMTREDGVFTLQIDEPMSLGQLTEFSQDMFPGIPLDRIAVWPEEEGRLVISIAEGQSVVPS